MPRFFYTLIIIFLVSSMVLARTIFSTNPENKISLVVFFVCLFLTLITFLSLVPFVVLARRSGEINYQKQLIRRILHYTTLITVFVVSLGILKVLGALNSLTFILLLILLITFEFFASR